VLNEGYVRKIAKSINLLDDIELAIICKNEKIVKHFLDELTAQGFADNLFGFE